jgi:methenyltetrahydromethanopterin cyclohydrolase
MILFLRRNGEKVKYLTSRCDVSDENIYSTDTRGMSQIAGSFFLSCILKVIITVYIEKKISYTVKSNYYY